MERVVRDVLQGVLEVIVLVKGHGGVWRGHSGALRGNEEEGDGSSQQDGQQQQPPAEDLRLGNQKRKIIIMMMTIRQGTSPKGKERPMLTQGDEAESVILRRVEGVSFSLSFLSFYILYWRFDV